MKRPTAGLLLATLILTLSTSNMTLAGQPTTVPLAIVDNYPVLPADIDGHKVRLLFDLGGNSLALTSSTLRQIGITPAGRIYRSVDPEGHIMESRTFDVPQLRIGSAVFRDVDGFVDDVHHAPRFGAQGFLGPLPFRAYRIVLNYRDGKMTLIPPGTPHIERAGCSGTAVPDPTGVVKAQTDFGDLILVWDTGSPVSYIRKTRIDATQAKVVNHAVITEHFRLNGVDFGPLRLRLIDFSEPPGVDGFIGGNFFSRHVVCLDFPRKRILIQR